MNEANDTRWKGLTSRECLTANDHQHQQLSCQPGAHQQRNVRFIMYVRLINHSPIH